MGAVSQATVFPESPGGQRRPCLHGRTVRTPRRERPSCPHVRGDRSDAPASRGVAGDGRWRHSGRKRFRPNTDEGVRAAEAPAGCCDAVTGGRAAGETARPPARRRREAQARCRTGSEGELLGRGPRGPRPGRAQRKRPELKLFASSPGAARRPGGKPDPAGGSSPLEG